MPKILRIINRLNLGGPTYNAALLTKYLAPEYETLLVAGNKLESEESSEFILQDLGIQAQKIKSMQRNIGLLNEGQAYYEIDKIIKKFKPDIVHTHATKAGVLGRLAAASNNVPTIVHTFHGHVFHSYFNPLVSRSVVYAERFLAKKSDKIIAISELQKNELVNSFKICEAEKINVVPLGLDLSKFSIERESKRLQFRNQYKIADDEIAIGIIGRLVSIKNHDLFIKAIKIASEKTEKKIKAIIIGDGELKPLLLQKVNQLALNHLFIFTSWIKNIDTALAGLDIVALSSLNEGTPVSLIEAQAAGKAIVSTQVGGVLDTVKENETALICKDFDPETFAEKLLQIIENPALAYELGEKGQEFVLNRFSYTRLINDMRQVYENR